MKEKKYWWITVGVKYEINQEYVNEICSEIIDLLRKKHELSPLQSHIVLKTVLDSLEETMEGLFKEEVA